MIQYKLSPAMSKENIYMKVIKAVFILSELCAILSVLYVKRL